MVVKVPHVYQVFVNLSLMHPSRGDSKAADAEERVRRLVQTRLEGPEITVAHIKVHRAVENG
jgi:hypothetical protein